MQRLKPLIFPVSELLLLLMGGLLFWIVRPSGTITGMYLSAPVLYSLLAMVLLSLPVLMFFFQKPLHEASAKEYLYLIPLALMLISTNYTISTSVNMTNLFLVSAGIYLILNRKLRLNVPFLWFYYAYFLTLAVSWFWSDDPAWGWVLLRRSLTWLSIPFAFCAFNLNKEQWQQLMLVVMRSAVIFAILSCLTWWYNINLYDLNMADFFDTKKHLISRMDCSYLVYEWNPYQHPSFNAIGLTIGLISGIYLTRERIVHWAELLGYLLMVVLLVVLTQSRIGIVMTSVTMLLGIGVFLPRKRAWLIGYGCVLFLLAVTAVWAWFNVKTSMSLDPARQHLFSDALSHIKQHPWLGVGLGDLPPTIYNHDFGNPHNQFLGDWQQSGLPALLALLAMLGSVAYTAVKQRNLPLGMFLIVMIFFMMIEMPFNLIKGICYFVYFTCFFVRSDIQSEK